MHVAVTGGSGRIGQATVKELLDHGYRVTSIDQRPAPERLCPSHIADLTDFGQTVNVLKGVEAVIHLAAIPSAGTYADPTVFSTNVISHWNVLEAAHTLGIGKVVTASSIQVISQVGADRPVFPRRFPVDETQPTYPQQSYALSKVLGEEIDRSYGLKGMQVLGMRFAWVTTVEYVRQIPADRRGDPIGFWSYVDVRDVAQICRLGIEAEGLGAEAFFVTAADTLRIEPSRELIRRHFPEAEIDPQLDGNQSCVDIRKARRLLGYDPKYSWREGV